MGGAAAKFIKLGHDTSTQIDRPFPAHAYATHAA